MANSFKKLLCLCQLCLYSRCRSLAAFLTAVLERAERKQFVFLTSDYQTKASENNLVGILPVMSCLKHLRGGCRDAGGAGLGGTCPTCGRGRGCWLSWDESKEQPSSLFWDACFFPHRQLWNGKIHPRAVAFQLFFYAGKINCFKVHWRWRQHLLSIQS